MHLNLRKNTYYCCGISEIGPNENNEDSVIIGKNVFSSNQICSRLKSGFFIGVADGVSNSSMGAFASKMCLECLLKTKILSKTDFEKLTLDIHKKIVKHGEKNKKFYDMQTTLCTLYVGKNEKLCYINVGDSRLYRFRNKELRQISKDQSFVEMLYDSGKISHEQKRSHSGRNLVLTVMGAVSQTPKPETAFISDEFNLGDIFLLCTDGLSDYVLDADIESVLVQPLPLEARLKKLCELALQNGSTDNISIAAVTKCE